MGRASAASEYEIHINIPEFKLRLYRHGVLFREYPIAVGSIVSPSNLGWTEIINRVEHPTYYPPDWYAEGLRPIPPGPENPVGTRWLGLGFKGYGIHGTNDPASIGRAVSAGCVRMLNRDVEELAEFVGPGTPVRFSYETVKIAVDEHTGRPTIRVFRDLYGAGTNRLERVLRLLAEQGWSGVDAGALSAVLAEAGGQARPLPISAPWFADGEERRGGVFDWGGRLYADMSALRRWLGEPVDWEAAGDEILVFGRVLRGAFVLGGALFAPVEEAARALGLRSWKEEGAWHLARIPVEWRSERLPERAWTDPYRVWLPASAIGRRKGVPVEWDEGLQAVVIGGRIHFGARRLAGGEVYLPADRLETAMGVRVLTGADSGIVRLGPG